MFKNISILGRIWVSKNNNASFNKMIHFLKGHLKAVIAIVAVVVVSIFGLVYISNRSESIISNVKVTFKGYDGHGELTYNSETFL